MPHEFTHPARIAEKIATVDLLSDSHVEWGMGRSSPMEQVTFGVRGERSKSQLLAAVRSTAKMWEEEYFSEDSEYLKLPLMMIVPTPFQPPQPPAWMAAASLESVRLAGQNRLGLPCFSIQHLLDDLTEIIAIHRCDQSNVTPIASVRISIIQVYTLAYFFTSL